MRLQGAVFDGTEALLDDGGAAARGEGVLSLMKIEDVWMYLICDGAAAPVRAALEQSGLWSYFRGLLSAVEQGGPLDPELYERQWRLRTARRATVIFTAREALRAAGGFQVVLVGPDHSVASLWQM